MRSIASSLLLLGCCLAAGSGENARVRAEENKAKDNRADSKDQKRKPKFTIGKETTYVNGPLNEDGTIDYTTAINERMRQGVTPDKNANVLIWKVLGPHPEGVNMPAEFFKWLGIEPLPEKGTYFVSQYHYGKEQLKLEPGQTLQAFCDEIDQVSQRPWTAKEHPRVAEWLKANDKPLALLHEATKRPRYYSPLVSRRSKDGTFNLIGALLPSVQKSRELAQTLKARAMLAVAEGRYDDAWQDLLACHRLGRLLARGATLIELLVGIAIEGVVSSADLALLEQATADAKVQPKTIHGWQRDLQRLPPMPGVAEKVDLGERFMGLDCVMLLARGKWKELQLFSSVTVKEWTPLVKYALKEVNWDPTLHLFNRWYDSLSTALRIEDRGKRQKRLKEIEEALRARKQEIGYAGAWGQVLLFLTMSSEQVYERVGQIMVTLFMPAVTKVQQARDRSEQTQSNLHVAFALACYRREHGRYPDKLDALAPAYLKSVPKDIFSGDELIYRPSKKGYLLYSVGVNGRDDDGRGYGDETGADDLKVRMPLPELRRKTP